jgi:hypothetical protein
MNATVIRRGTFHVLTLALAALVVGCSSGSSQKYNSPITSLKQTRNQVIKTRDAVDHTQAALDRLAEAGDVKVAVDQLAAAAKELASEAEATTAQAKAFREQSRSHIAQWEREMEEVQGGDIHATSAQRRAAVSAHYQAIREASDGARTSYLKYSSLLTEIETALTNDPTPAGVGTIGHVTKTALAEGEALQKHLDQVIVKVKAIYAGSSTLTAK